MIRILPGLALLLLLGGAGLGFAYTTVHALQEYAMNASSLAGGIASNQDMFEAIQRMRTILDLLVFTWSASFGLLGVGCLLQHRGVQQPDWATHLAQLIKTSDTDQQAILLRLEALQQTTSREIIDDIKKLASLEALQQTTSREIIDDIKKLATHAKQQAESTPVSSNKNALTPQHVPPSPFPAYDQRNSSPRLAISAPSEVHDKQDEEFEPF